MAYVQMRLQENRHYALKCIAAEDKKDMTNILAEAVDFYLKYRKEKGVDEIANEPDIQGKAE